jgi:hypothetical protein
MSSTSMFERRSAGTVIVGLAAVVLAAGACTGEDACLVGAEGCSCTSASACEAGLTCQGGNVCVRNGMAPEGPAVPGQRPPAQTASVSLIVGMPQVDGPRDLAFNPRRQGELWVANAGTNSMTIVFGATGSPGSFEILQRRDRNHLHFMPSPSSLAFGADQTNDAADNAALALGTFATCHVSRNGGNNFMGPVLWSSDLSVFAARNGTLGSHLDMLHQSPDCMGITWAGSGNVYFTFDGLTGSVSRYDFQLDHGVGNDDHTDGIIWRYVVGQVKAVPEVPSHLAYLPEQQTLYIADTGNARLVKLAMAGATKGRPLVPKQDEAESWEMTGVALAEVVPRASGLLTAPSGLEIKDGHLYVSDSATGIIHKVRLDGTPVRAVQTDAQPGGLTGLTFGPDGRLYFTDQLSDRVLRVDGEF